MEAIYLVSDEGTGIRAGHAEVMCYVVRQSDTYPAIALQLGRWVEHLEKAVCKAIGMGREQDKVKRQWRLLQERTKTKIRCQSSLI